MAKNLPVDERLITAGQLVVRARIFYEIWRYYEGAETRPKIIDTMNEYSEFFRFDSHAHFFSFIVYIAALFEAREDTINIPNLVRELKDLDAVSEVTISKITELLGQIKAHIKGVFKLRHNLFGHRSASLSYADAFEKASITPNQLLELTKIALQIVNFLLKERKLEEQSFNELVLEDAEAMFKALGARP
jgi:hypothetical protein